MILYKTTKFLKDCFTDIPSVKTVTTDTEDRIDWYSNTIYPLININLISATSLEAVHRVSFNVNIFQQRNVEGKLNNEKFLGDNMIDNLDEAYTIATKVINKIRSFYNTDEVDVVSISDVQFLKNVRNKELDGCWFNVILEIPNVIEC